MFISSFRFIPKDISLDNFRFSPRHIRTQTNFQFNNSFIIVQSNFIAQLKVKKKEEKEKSRNNCENRMRFHPYQKEKRASKRFKGTTICIKYVKLMSQMKTQRSINYFVFFLRQQINLATSEMYEGKTNEIERSLKIFISIAVQTENNYPPFIKTKKKQEKKNDQ